jgi:hypothetical protein
MRGTLPHAALSVEASSRRTESLSAAMCVRRAGNHSSTRMLNANLTALDFYSSHLECVSLSDTASTNLQKHQAQFQQSYTAYGNV